MDKEYKPNHDTSNAKNHRDKRVPIVFDVRKHLIDRRNRKDGAGNNEEETNEGSHRTSVYLVGA